MLAASCTCLPEIAISWGIPETGVQAGKSCRYRVWTTSHCSGVRPAAARTSSRCARARDKCASVGAAALCRLPPRRSGRRRYRCAAVAVIAAAVAVACVRCGLRCRRSSSAIGACIPRRCSALATTSKPSSKSSCLVALRGARLSIATNAPDVPGPGRRRGDGDCDCDCSARGAALPTKHSVVAQLAGDRTAARCVGRGEWRL